MPTADRRQFLSQSIRCFLAQDHAEKELIIVDDGADSVADLVPRDSRIRYFRHEMRQPVGAKRNFACREARGEVLVHWDDDDWSAPWRLRYQLEQLRDNQADICGLSRVFFHAPEQGKAWEYVYPTGQRPWVYGASLCYKRAFWQANPFPEIRVGEDTRFVWADARARVHACADSRFMVALVHDGNTSRKHTSDPRYRSKPVAEIEQLMDVDAAAYHPQVADLKTPPAANVPSATLRRALITAGPGIGDIVRTTPLIRAVHRLGYKVEVLLLADYPQVAQLLEGAAEVGRLHCLPHNCRTGRSNTTSKLSVESYEVVTLTPWTARLRSGLKAKRIVDVERDCWLQKGYSHGIDHLARELGWQGEMPEPFAQCSARKFHLPPDTVAIHPGCNSVSPWKKWHGFDDLAGKFPNVAIIGTEEDLRTDGTYFHRAFAWPEHARNFVGQLSLPDTAALLRECAALVSNDSGLMHLAAALGVPAFGIFGITSPEREGMPSNYFSPITKGLPCETACHAGTWGRRDCERHLECLKTLTAEEVFMKVAEIIPAAAPAQRPIAAIPLQPVPTARTPDAPAESINLLYYANVFDASGYGQAARGYIHALHAAGVNVGVVDLAPHGRQVRDPLVESLIGRRMEADFHLFHGIPPHWARRAFPMRNVIAMTVWETDTMPPQWRPALNHALEVWMPCEFNVSVFGRALEKPVFRLPHAWIPTLEGSPPGSAEGCGVREGDYVFYSIFEWQDRKGPCETIEAFLRAFPEPGPVVLVLKTNHGAAGIAAAALADLRRRVPSQARVELRAEAWSAEQIAVLQERGNCYVSLHRGEGWNYPLFEAASRGKAIVATDFSGPLEYLNPATHHLVQHRPVQVRQRYAYYSTAMHWAEPDVAHAVETMRAAFSGRAESGSRVAAGERIRRDFSPEVIGHAARRRLLHLLRGTNSAKWRRIDSHERQDTLPPPVPIPGEWYDADYFEHGVKSNWRDGYHWDSFSGLFRETATFLTGMFPEAQSFLDAGCAMGFLVRTLRERGKECWGFDHSPWALERADHLAKPHLWQASAETVEIKQHCDVLLVFSLLESLTEKQARAFLEQARPSVRQAVFATIATRPLGAEALHTSCDQDLSHVTMRDREWWRQLFLEAGWRQDAIHKIAERSCQTGALSEKMGWSVYLFSPGE